MKSTRKIWLAILAAAAVLAAGLPAMAATWTYDAHASTDLNNAGAYAEGGGIPADGDTIVISVTTDPTNTLDIEGTVGLTWTANGPDTFGMYDFVNGASCLVGLVTVSHASGTITLGGDFEAGGFTLNTDGTLAGGGVTLALGAGAFTSTKGTVTGMLNVVVGAGGIVYAAGTYSAATLNVTVPAGVTTTVLSWGTTTNKITALVIDGNATFSGETQCASFGGGGTAALSTRQLKILPAESNFWTFSGTISGTNAAALTIFPSANISNTQCILGPSVGGTVISGVLSANKTVTADGGLTCGPLLIAGSTSPGLAMGTGNLTCGAITLGPTGATATGGRLVLGTGTATFTTLAGGNAANSGNTLTCNSSRINLGGNMTLAGLAADFGTAAVFATANNKTIDGTSAASVASTGCDIFANGNTLTVDDMGTATVRCWGGCTVTGTKTNVQDLPGPPDEY